MLFVRSQVISSFCVHSAHIARLVSNEVWGYRYNVSCRTMASTSGCSSTVNLCCVGTNMHKQRALLSCAYCSASKCIWRLTTNYLLVGCEICTSTKTKRFLGININIVVSNCQHYQVVKYYLCFSSPRKILTTLNTDESSRASALGTQTIIDSLDTSGWFCERIKLSWFCKRVKFSITSLNASSAVSHTGTDAGSDNTGCWYAR